MEVDEAHSTNDIMDVVVESSLPLGKDVVGDSVAEAGFMKDMSTHHFFFYQQNLVPRFAGCHDNLKLELSWTW